MAYRCNDSERINVNFYEFKNTYNISSLLSNTNSMKRQIERLKEAIVMGEEYLADLTKHAQMIYTLEFRPYIIAERKENRYSTKRIEYQIKVYKVPVKDGKHEFSYHEAYETISEYNYSGKEKKQFNLKLDELMKNHRNATLKTIGIK